MAVCVRVRLDIEVSALHCETTKKLQPPQAVFFIKSHVCIRIGSQDSRFITTA
ncbi:hypothetical protein AMECASPLE_013030, partial [Ameca splendens]